MSAHQGWMVLVLVLTACSGNDVTLAPPTSAPSPAPTVTRVPTPVPTPTVLPTPTPSGSPSPSPSVAPSPTLQPTPSTSPTPDPMAEARRLFEQEQALRARAEAL